MEANGGLVFKMRGQRVTAILLRLVAIYAVLEMMRYLPGTYGALMNYTNQSADPSFVNSLKMNLGWNVILLALELTLLFRAEWVAQWICPVDETFEINVRPERWLILLVQLIGLLMFVQALSTFGSCIKALAEPFFYEDKANAGWDAFTYTWYSAAFLASGYVLVRHPGKVVEFLKRLEESGR